VVSSEYRIVPAGTRTTLARVRRLVFAVIGLGVVAILVIGLIQSGGNKGPSESQVTSKAPPPAEVRRAFAGSPAPLARLHREANRIIPGGRDELNRQLKALRGYPVVVNVWGSWCGPCRVEFPSFQVQAVDFGKKVAFLGVNARDNRGAARQFLREFPVTYPSVEDANEAVLGKLGGRGYPSTVYYGRDGKQVFIHQGQYQTERDLVDDIHRYTGV
jgi:cytochrome c biogenesis protein CcmG/thiol:disulfide interchange protein DsbE